MQRGRSTYQFSRRKNKIAEIPIESKGGKWKWWTANAVSDMGIKALYFQFEGDGNLDFLEFELEE